MNEPARANLTHPTANAAPSRSRGGLLFAAGLAVGLACGFALGVVSVRKTRELFVEALQQEQPADVAHPKDLERAAYQLRYPGNWRVDASGEGEALDRIFTVKSPGHSFVMFIIADGEVDPKTALNVQVKAQTAKVLRDATRTPFDHWGAFHGAGMLLAGKDLGLVEATMRIFAFRGGDHTFTILESTFDKDRAMVTPGFALVERTFVANVVGGRRAAELGSAGDD
jgi:hypothetical protein